MNKKKLNKQDYIFRNCQNQVLKKNPGQINGIDFYIANLEDCEVYLFDWLDQILIDDCKNCKIYTGPVVGSVFLRGSENIAISTASNQFRISDSKNVQAFIFSKSDPALENCLNISIGPYNFHYPKAREHFSSAKFDFSDPAVNKWSQVYDFTPNLEKRNWNLIHPDFFSVIAEKIEGFENELIEELVQIHKMYGGNADFSIIIGSQESQESNKEMFSFNINTSAKEAKNIVEEFEERNEYDLEEIKENKESKILKDNKHQVKLNQQINEKNNKEVEEKKNRIKSALEDLLNWKKNYISIIEERKKNNRIKKEIFEKENTNTLSWIKVGENVDFKIADHKGARDISEMRQAILSKINDIKSKK